jgi:hypothetical protein
MWIDIILSIFTIAAIIIGGIWAYMLFVKKRENVPHVEIEHELYHCEMPYEKYLLRLSLIIRNIGTVLLEVRHLKIKVKQIKPCNIEVLDIIKNVEYPIRKGEDLLPWRVLYDKHIELEEGKYHEIEPGEEDYRYYEFIIPMNTENVIVSTHIRYRYENEIDFGWQRTTVYDFLEQRSSGRG